MCTARFNLQSSSCAKGTMNAETFLRVLQLRDDFPIGLVFCIWSGVWGGMHSHEDRALKKYDTTS